MSFLDDISSRQNTSTVIVKSKTTEHEYRIINNIKKIRVNISNIEENLMTRNREKITNQEIESLQSKIQESNTFILDTQQIFKEWTSYLAANPIDKQRSKFLFSKLKSNFHSEMSKINQLSISVEEAFRRISTFNQSKTFLPNSKNSDKNFTGFISESLSGIKQSIRSEEIDGFISDSADEPYEPDNQILEFEDGSEHEYLIKRNIVEDKLSGINRIRGQVLQAHQAFRDLAGLVIQHDSELETIESNIDNTYIHSSKVITELERSYQHALNRRKRKIILLLSIIFLSIFIFWIFGFPFSFNNNIRTYK